MGGSFATSDTHSHFNLKPLRVASVKAGVYQEAKNLASELPGWKILEADDRRLVLKCERKGGALSGPSTVIVTIEGPDGVPSTTVNVESTSTGGIPGFARDKANVLEFMKPLHRRVC
jgi:hypothetical protein